METTYFDTAIKSSCCGCKVCAAICPAQAISFSNDEEGFWYPKINLSLCLKCNKCRDFCPNIEFLDSIKEENQTFAAYIKSDEILKSSVSGGMFTAFSDIILNNGGYVFGCVYDENCRAVISIAETKDERDKMRGSKYVQSDMGIIYKELKEAVKSNKPVLFSGLPCQIAAVNKFFGKERPSNLYTLEIICHGVPSPGIFAEYVELQSIKAKKRIKNVIFRDKSKGWTMPLRKFVYEDGSSAAELLNADAFNNLYLGTDCILRPSCYECKYAGKQRIADLSIADFWGIQKKHPEMFNNNKGCSLVLVNTQKGSELFEKAKDSFVYKSVSLADAQEHNGPLNQPTKVYWERDAFFKNKERKGLEWCCEFYKSKKIFARVFRKLRYIKWKITKNKL